MKYLARVQAAIDFIEANLCEDLSLVQVAKEVAFSPYHFHFIFGSTVGETFKNYIRKRRLTEAAHKLRETELGILDIAVEFGFESQEAFTRAFKKMFHVNPGAYRNAKVTPKYYEKQKLSLGDLEHRMQGIKLKEGSATLEEFYLIGVEYLGTVGHNGEIGQLWDRFVSRIGEVSEALEPREYFGYCYASPPMIQQDQMRYIAGVKVKSLDAVPVGMVGVKVPTQKYAVFTHKGKPERIKTSYDYIYSVWFPKSGCMPADGPDFERYDSRFIIDSDDSELDLYVPIAMG